MKARTGVRLRAWRIPSIRDIFVTNEGDELPIRELNSPTIKRIVRASERITSVEPFGRSRTLDLSGKKDTIGVLITDDHPVMRDGLRAAIEHEPDMEVLGEASDGQEAIDQYRKLRPDVSLIDLQMPNVDGLQAITSIRSEFPEAIIVVLTTYPGDARVIRALTLGATSYLLKTARREEIIKAIRGAIAGRYTVAPEVAQQIAFHTGSEGLTPRELSVLQLVARGQSNRLIAETLNISEDTVKARMKSIMAKLEAQDRTHAVTIAIRRGFIDS